MATGPILGFGPFQLDPQRRRVLREGEPLPISERQFAILCLLASRSGQIVSKDTLIEAAWRGVAVGDNSLEQAISSLRRALGRGPDGSPNIETLALRDYRFVAAVTRIAARQSDEALETRLTPFRGFVEGRASLETLTHDGVARARAVFGEVVAAAPEYVLYLSLGGRQGRGRLPS